MALFESVPSYSYIIYLMIYLMIYFIIIWSLFTCSIDQIAADIADRVWANRKPNP